VLIYRKEVAVTRDIKAFTIEDAEVFARSKGLDDAVTYINGLDELDGWKGDRLGVKTGKYIMLFLAYGLFEEFKQTYWPQEDAPDNYHGKLVYIAIALAYDEAVRKMKQEASS